MIKTKEFFLEGRLFSSQSEVLDNFLNCPPNKVAFLEHRLFFSQSELVESFLNCSDWLDERRPSEKATSYMDWTCKQVNKVVLLRNHCRIVNKLASCAFRTL